MHIGVNEMRSPLILAVDTDSIDIAKKWVDATSEFIGTYKVGLEFFLACGLDGVKQIAEHSQRDIFLDLKLHDIPNTVAGAVRSIRAIAPKFLTVHASGGAAMIAAAAAEADGIVITAVTVLTSLSQSDVKEIGFANPIESLAPSLAKLACDAGAGAIVCSPLEITALRQVIGPSPAIITPGVRLAPGGDDQKRTMTPRQALSSGANYLVIGRPITGAWKDGARAMTVAAEEIFLSLNS